MSLIEVTRHRRNTPASVVHICGVDVFFSYETAVGCSPSDEPSFQRENVWGPTTGRHLNEWGFNRQGIEKLDANDFEHRLSRALVRGMGRVISSKLEGNHDSP